MKKIFRNIITYIIIFGVLFYFINLILSYNNIEFMEWVYYSLYSIIIIGILLGILQLILKIKSKLKKNISLGVFGIIGCIIIYVIINLFTLMHNPEYIIVKDNKKMVATVTMFHHTYVYYYDYINVFMKSKKAIDSEHYSTGGINPFKTDLNYMKLIER